MAKIGNHRRLVVLFGVPRTRYVMAHNRRTYGVLPRDVPLQIKQNWRHRNWMATRYDGDYVLKICVGYKLVHFLCKGTPRVVSVEFLTYITDFVEDGAKWKNKMGAVNNYCRRL